MPSIKDKAIAFLKQNVREDKLGYDLNLVLQQYGDRAMVKILHQYQENLRDAQQIEETTPKSKPDKLASSTSTPSTTLP